MSEKLQHKIITQGIPGSFHFEATKKYFTSTPFEFVSADSFLNLAKGLQNDSSVDYGVMAIENSTAGTIIKNYRILREHEFRIVGEIYLPIIHNLLGLKGQNLSEVKEVWSHPMAINQCLSFLEQNNINKHIALANTAQCAKNLIESREKGVAVIAGHETAEIYNLEILAPSIQTSKINYTRFFILQRGDKKVSTSTFDKASIYLRTEHKRGSLLKVLEVIYKENINLSKLQSYPIMDNLSKYYFHLDLEFDDPSQYHRAFSKLKNVTQKLEVLGLYRNALVDFQL